MSTPPQRALLLFTSSTTVCAHRSRSSQSEVLCKLPPDSIYEFSYINAGWACLSPNEYLRVGLIESSDAGAAWCPVDAADGPSPSPF